ncbi:MAG: PfkB family carbohydrate kinase [Hyphomonas sp.]
MGKPSPTGLIAAAAGKRIVCVGDVMLDRFVYGQVTRISPEAPVPIMQRHREAAMPGGAGNVARNLASLGMLTSLIGVVGDDAEGRELAQLLGTLGDVDADLIVMRGRPTTLKTRFVAGGQQLLRVDAEEASFIDKATETELIASIHDDAAHAALIVISDYAKGAVTDRVIQAALDAGAAHGIPVIADPKGRDFARYGAVDLLKPNGHELAHAFGVPVESDQDVSTALRIAIDALPARGGCRHPRGQGHVLHPAGRRRHASGRTGPRGATMSPAPVTPASRHSPSASPAAVRQAVDLAIAASGIAVGKAGTATVSAAELRTALEMGLVTGGVSHIPLDTAISQVQAWRDAGFTVGFTNGCFDILHRVI